MPDSITLEGVAERAAVLAGEFPGSLRGPRRDTASLPRRRLFVALAVALAYFAGTQIGVLTRLPPTTPSAIWPPNAILLAALILSPPRDWWWLLLAALPAHLAFGLAIGWPAPLVLALFVTNCSEALIGAAGVRALSDSPGRFDTLWRMVAFIGAAGLLAPIASSFGDAAIVTTFRHEAFWTVWRSRTFSNVVTDLTLVPAICLCLTEGRRWLTRSAANARLEAALLAVATVAVAVAVFARPASSPLLPGAPPTPVALLLPGLLWAAVRFGPGGASLGLLATALVGNWAGTHHTGPFEAMLPLDGVLALQLLVAVIGIPLLCLAAVIEERWDAEGQLANRLEFEQLLSRMSGAFVLTQGQGIAETAAIWLGKLAVYLDVDCGWLLVRSEDGAMTVASSWVAPGRPVLTSLDPIRELGTFVAGSTGKSVVTVDDADTLPEPERQSLQRLAVRALLGLPIGAGGRVLGVIIFGDAKGVRHWSPALQARLRLVGEVLASALARQAADTALRAGEAMKSAILASLSSGVAVLDRAGHIVAVNDRWTQLAHEQHEIVLGEVTLGANYLELCRVAAERGAPHADAARQGIESVLGRSRSSFTLDYETDGPAGERWANLRVVPLSSALGGAVVTHTDVTERRRAEVEARLRLQELAHFTRVSAMGELTASLAHQLNQPLTGILTNAQAARRLLDDKPPQLKEIRSILDDIVDDDRRAADVIQQLRELLQKGRSDHSLLDLNSVVQDVARLVSSDALIHSVVITEDLTPEMPIVRGNRVELQQVVLNLLLNALDAVRDTPDSRRVEVRTRIEPPGVEVLVRDTGRGLDDGLEARIFEPFFSTKPGGMGMGLSIARSIVDSHGGRISARPVSPRGAEIRFVLPLAGGRFA